ncbi:hypothetical protein PHBOTO_005357, partial [Pseudozyma hubeiensis]
VSHSHHPTSKASSFCSQGNQGGVQGSWQASKRTRTRPSSSGNQNFEHLPRYSSAQRSKTRPSTSSTPRSKRILALAPTRTALSVSVEHRSSELVALQKAIDGQDMSVVSLAWQALGTQVTQLGLAEHEKLLQLCSSNLSSTRAAHHTQNWRSLFSEFASAASLTGQVGLISGWFRLLLANGQPELVVDLWQTIVQARLDHGPHQIDSVTDDLDFMSSTETTRDLFVRLDVSTDGERVDIHDLVCLVVFSCAQSTRAVDFVNLFDKVEFGSPFRLFFQMPRAKRIYNSIPASALDKLNKWETAQSLLSEVELARGLSSGSGGPQRIARLLGSLFQLHQIDEAYSVFNTAMRVSSGPHAWLTLQAPHESSTSLPPSSRAQWTESCWSVCLSNFIATGRTDLAMDVWTKFQQRRLVPTPSIWNSLLDGYGRANNPTAAKQTWSTALNSAKQDSSSALILPDEQMYTTMINIHFKARETDEAMALLSDMVAKSDRHGGRLHVRAETFNAALNGLFLNQRPTQAQTLLDQMLSKGPAPNIGTINTLLRSYARVGDLESIVSSLRLAEKLKLEPDVVTFTTILDALLRKGGESATASVVRTLDIMSGMGVQPNVVTYTALIKACLVGAEAAQLDIASQGLFGDPAQQKGQQPSTEDARIEAALGVLDRMLKAKVAPSEITYSALIGGCLQNPDAVAHAFATKAVPHHYCHPPKPLHRLGENAQTVQRWSHESPQVSLALLLLEHMKGRGLPPTPTTFRYLIEGLCSTHTDQAAFIRAMDLIDDMLLRGPVSDPARKLGPFASMALKGKEVFPPTLHAPNHRAWIIIFSSLLDRLENGPRDKVAITSGARALGTAIRLVREMGSLAGAEGGMSLSRLVERAASLTSKIGR